MKMKRPTLFIFLIFISGLLSVLVFRIWQAKRAKNISFSPQESTFVSEPPSGALTGELAAVLGQVEKKPRGKDEYKKIKIGENIFQGEKLKTDEKSQATIQFPEFGQLTVFSNTEISFANLIPANFLVHQISGKAKLSLLKEEQSLSVRSLSLLYSLESGKSEITVDKEKGRVIINQLEGKAKLAIVDLENETHVWEIEAGETALVDDFERWIEIK